jgi:hypothetical protein
MTVMEYPPAIQCLCTGKVIGAKQECRAGKIRVVPKHLHAKIMDESALDVLAGVPLETPRGVVHVRDFAAHATSQTTPYRAQYHKGFPPGTGEGTARAKMPKDYKNAKERIFPHAPLHSDRG